MLREARALAQGHTAARGRGEGLPHPLPAYLHTKLLRRTQRPLLCGSHALRGLSSASLFWHLSGPSIDICSGKPSTFFFSNGDVPDLQLLPPTCFSHFPLSYLVLLQDSGLPYKNVPYWIEIFGNRASCFPFLRLSRRGEVAVSDVQYPQPLVGCNGLVSIFSSGARCVAVVGSRDSVQGPWTWAALGGVLGPCPTFPHL